MLADGCFTACADTLQVRGNHVKLLSNPFLIIAAVFVFLVALGALKKSRPNSEKPRARAVLTPRELEAFAILNNALAPRYSVLAQVAFSALLTAKKLATRNTFNRKMADFVVIDHGGAVVAVVEIDDRSHDGRESSDGRRDDMLINAGYRVIRYRKLPTREQVQKDITHVPEAMSSP